MLSIIKTFLNSGLVKQVSSDEPMLGAFNLDDWFRSLLKRFNIPYTSDGLCPGSLRSPVGYLAEGNKLQVWKDDTWKDFAIGTGGSGGGDETLFEDDIIVKIPAGRTFGKYESGDTIPAKGKTASWLLLDVLSDSFPASATLWSSPNPSNIEVGTIISINLTSAYTQNDGEPEAEMSLKKNGIEISTFTPFLDTNVIINKTPKTYQVVYNSSVWSNSITYIGMNKVFHGPVTSVPTTSAQIRALASSFENGPIVLNTGTSETQFAICIPADKTLSNVTDLDNLNLNITSEYPYVGTVDVSDAGGVLTARKLYIKTQSVPYTTNTRHQISIQ